VVFDADGVLVDTEPAWVAARRALFERHGLAFGPAEERRTLGTGVAGTGQVLSALLGQPGRADGLSEDLLDLLLDEISKAPSAALPGALHLLGALRGRLPVAVASNSPRILLSKTLEEAGLDGLFDVVLGADDVLNPKPAPDLYATAVQRLGTEPADSMAVEDAPAGVEAARAAGLMVIGIRSRPDVSLDADKVADSLSDPRFPAWLGLIGGGSP
jgi:HAD superfamily hydrolase (TIGR01509 family)